MREIKFRAWVKRQNSMVPVNGIDFKKNEVAHVETIGGWEFGGCWYPIETVELMQFTGLYDKNGKEIYEGDIVKCHDVYSKANFTAVVEFGNPNGDYVWGWQLKRISGDDDVNFDILCWVEMEESGAYCEVIGNIYENPELLEVEDEKF